MTDEKESNEVTSETDDEALHLSTDTGGTFTDFVYLERSGIHAFKILSTPTNPALSIGDGLRRFRRLLSFSHGTTVATNAVLERKGDRTALLTTKGFRDVIFIGRQQRQHLYSFRDMRPTSLIAREDAYEIEERIGPDGKVLVPLNKQEVEASGSKLVGKGYTSVAVSYLFSFLNPAHERITGEILEAMGLNVSLSSEVLPEYREFERTSTTLMDAFIRGKLGDYLGSLGDLILPYAQKEYYVMTGEGGVSPSTELLRVPSQGLLSGPAGGVSGALYLGEQVGLRNLITFDMGGTSTDISRISGLRQEYTTDAKLSGLPFSRYCINIITIGAGGGSIAHLDPGGAIRVGPESAGASPGPVCYDLGGEQVTVTDVNLLAGYLNHRDFLGKGNDLNVPKARAAVEGLARKLNYTINETIEGVLRIVNHNMASALRMVTTEAGKDPEDYSLFAFGGAGPMHGAGLARELGMKRVFVPFAAGMFSAFGILISDIVHGYSLTRVMPLDTGNLKQAEEILKDFQRKGADFLTKEGIPEESRVFLPSLDLRYRGQSYHLNVPFGSGIEDVKREFGKIYLKRYGYSITGEEEIVNIRLEVRGKRCLPPLPVISDEAPNGPYGHRDCLFGEWIEVPVFRRGELGAGFLHKGVAIIEDKGSTIVLPPGTSFRVDVHGNIEVRV
ncbi:MAG: hydantoinase/oxoprolinase family protein [Thermoplasmata archaeon]|nr:hydantoinase/oxoprolinase family protein [Thermoplasmata archaeon]